MTAAHTADLIPAIYSSQKKRLSHKLHLSATIVMENQRQQYHRRGHRKKRQG